MSLISIPFQYAATINQINGSSRVVALGNNVDVDTATQPEDVWAGASIGILNNYDHRFIPFPETAVSMEIVSSSSNDSALGTGARRVLINFLDSNWQQKFFIATMNGITPVLLPELAIRINSIRVVSNGTKGGANYGNISVRDSGGLGKTYSYIPAVASFPSPGGISKSAVYSVPADPELDLIGFALSINRTDTGDRWATFTTNIQNANGLAIEGLEISCSTTASLRHQAENMPISNVGEKTDFWIRCQAVSNSNTNCTASFIGVQRLKR